MLEPLMSSPIMCLLLPEQKGIGRDDEADFCDSPESTPRGHDDLFVDIGSRELNMMCHAEMLIHIGYPQRYCQVLKTKTAPLTVEADKIRASQLPLARSKEGMGA